MYSTIFPYICLALDLTRAVEESAPLRIRVRAIEQLWENHMVYISEIVVSA